MNQQVRCLQTLILTLRGTSHDAKTRQKNDTSFEFNTLNDLCLPIPFLAIVSSSYHLTITIHLYQVLLPSLTEITTFMKSLSTSCQTFGSLGNISVADETQWGGYLVVVLDFQIHI
jgi:hypothetical protein